MSRIRNWCFTSFDEAEPVYDASVMKYLIYGKEVCPETAKEHWQGYMCLNNPKGLNAMKSLFGTWHFEPRKGNHQQASDYCKKDGKYKVFGIAPEQGQRNDLEAVATAITQGMRPADIAADYPLQFMKYHKGIKELITTLDVRHNNAWRSVMVSVYWGPTGTGKTRKAVDENPNSFLLCDTSAKWFDGYNGECTLIIDDFVPRNIDTAYLLRLLDGYALQVPVKGGFVVAKWFRVIITSNYDPATWFLHNSPETRAAMARRLHNVIKIDAQKIQKGRTEVIGVRHPCKPVCAQERTEVAGNTNRHLIESALNAIKELNECTLDDEEEE